MAFLGPNGAGKTTTLDMLLGLSRPDSGAVRLFGTDPRAAVEAGRVAAVLQSGGLLRDLTIAETVRLVGSLYTASRRGEDVLVRAGIADIADRMVGKCSGGQQQRLRFALALLPDPDLLVLDEPTTGMDVEGRRSFWLAIRADTARGRTVLFATHYLDEADAYADRIVLIRGGHVVADGSAAQIKNLASGRVVSATLTHADPVALHRLPGVTQVETRGDRILVHAGDSDMVARYLLSETPARDVEIVARNLEDALPRTDRRRTRRDRSTDMTTLAPARLNTELLALKLRRLLRNRRTVVFTLVLPPVFFAIFGLQSAYRSQDYGAGNTTAYVMVSVAVYGAMIATTSGGAMVAMERAQGWTRQLRLTPLHPAGYVAVKVAVAMTLGLASVATVFVVGALTGAHLTAGAWLDCFVLAWLPAAVFAAFGLFMGYLLPSENVMQLLGPMLALFAFAGGLFTPLSGWFATASHFVPTYGVATLARLPFDHPSTGSVPAAVANIVVWAGVFVAGAALLYRRDTGR